MHLSHLRGLTRAPLSRSFRLLGLALALLFSLVACTGKEQEHPHGPLRIKIPMLGPGGYQMEVVDLLSVDDLVELKGWAARFLFSPVQSGNKLDGYQPKIRVVKNGVGTYIATDELSLQLLTIYYHMENLGLMDEMAGVKGLNNWPRTVAVNVNYMSSAENSKVENNALYSGDLDALLFVPYTQDALPIPVNAGIIGHEHFHSLFQKLVINPLGKQFPDSVPTLHDEGNMRAAFGFEKGPNPRPMAKVVGEGEPDLELGVSGKIVSSRDYYHSNLLRGLNEGLADFWGWLYSNDNDFVGQSLPQFRGKRVLDTPDKILSTDCFSGSLYYTKEQDPDNAGPTAKAYKYGTSVARTLRQFSLDYQKSRGLSRLQLKNEISAKIVNALKILRTTFSQLPEEQLLNTTDFITFFMNQFQNPTPEEVKALTSAVESTTSKEARTCR